MFDGGVGVESGGRLDRSIDIDIRDSLETGRDEGGDASDEDILVICMDLDMRERGKSGSSEVSRRVGFSR